jgi:hypothetical protein
MVAVVVPGILYATWPNGGVVRRKLDGGPLMSCGKTDANDPLFGCINGTFGSLTIYMDRTKMWFSFPDKCVEDTGVAKGWRTVKAGGFSHDFWRSP